MSSTRTFIQNPISKAVFIHLALLLLLLAFVTYAPKYQPSDAVTIDVIDQASKIAEKKSQKLEDQRSKTIVQKSAGPETKEAKPESYLSDKTRTVKDENSSAREGEADAPPSAAVVPNPHGGSLAKEAPSTAHKAVKLSDLGMKLTPRDLTPDHEDHQWAASQTGEAMRGGQYIKGMKEGEVSALNTKEFVFYSYFERVRQQLDQAWQPILRGQIEKIYKTGRKLASNSDYTTSTLVTLSEKGEILRVQVLEESGTHDLDQAAIQALNKAGPYPNPPKGLVDSSGTVKIRWDFVLRT